MADLGGSGLFVAIISMIFAVEISRLVIKSGFTIKMPEQVLVQLPDLLNL